MIGKMLADPALIKIAAAPPTKENVFKFMDAAERAGFVAARGAAQEESPVATQTPTTDLDQENMMLEQRIMELEKQLQPAEVEEVKVGKQNISLPTGDQYAPANLVKAVIQVESAGKADAVSNKGARGLMQLMPATARDLGVDANDPQENIEGGSRYLAQQLKKFGDPELALAAYNWGPSNVERAIKKIEADGKTPTWALIKQYVKIPRETREYVDKVLSFI
jgi:soluble lytic murein transglycosylase-like protein